MSKRPSADASELLQENTISTKSSSEVVADVSAASNKHLKVLKDLDDVDEWHRDQAELEDKSFNPINEKKTKEEFRNYVNSQRQQRVLDFYTTQHRLQTYQFVCDMEAKYVPLNHFKMGIWEALEYLDKIVDDSDPDTNLTQIQHALQTGEACRRKYPDPAFDWFHLTGLIHDLGKIIAVNDPALGLPGEEQWCVVGDTFPVGCPFSPKNVMSDSFSDNPDAADPKFNTGTGIYSEGCGLSKVKMSWGHDEYLYRVMVGNKVQLPLPALYMIRYHSFYPWHKEGAYQYLLDDQDREMLKYIKDFNECDLYSKAHVPPNPSEVIPYYKSLIEKYCPGKLNW